MIAVDRADRLVYRTRSVSSRWEGAAERLNRLRHTGQPQHKQKITGWDIGEEIAEETRHTHVCWSAVDRHVHHIVSCFIHLTSANRFISILTAIEHMRVKYRSSQPISKLLRFGFVFPFFHKLHLKFVCSVFIINLFFHFLLYLLTVGMPVDIIIDMKCRYVK